MNKLTNNDLEYERLRDGYSAIDLQPRGYFTSFANHKIKYLFSRTYRVIIWVLEIWQFYRIPYSISITHHSEF